MQVTVTGFARMVEIIRGLAEELCRGHIVMCLEGGYHLPAIAYSVKATFDTLIGNTGIDDPLGQSPRRSGAPGIDRLLKTLKEIHDLP